MKPRNEFDSFEEVKKHIFKELGKQHLQPEDYEKNLQTGDLILFNGGSNVSWRIKFWMPYKITLWSHVGMVVKLEKPKNEAEIGNPSRKKLKAPNFFLAESAHDGVRLLSLELVLKNYEGGEPYEGNAIILRHEDFDFQKNTEPKTIHQRQAIITDFVLHSQNTPFDNPDFFRMTFRVLLLRVKFMKKLFWKHYYFRKKPPFICTELVYHAFEEADIKLPHTSGIISPEDFWYNEKNVPIGVLK